MQSLVLAAMEGHRGCFTPPHLRHRIVSTVSLSEQTKTLYLFHLNKVASEVLYLEPRAWCLGGGWFLFFLGVFVWVLIEVLERKFWFLVGFHFFGG